MGEKWETAITKVQPDNLQICGYPLRDLVERRTLPEVANLLVTGDLPDVRTRENIRKTAIEGAQLPSPPVSRNPGEDISKALAKCILLDDALAQYPDRPAKRTAFALGRAARYIAHLGGTEAALVGIGEKDQFSEVVFRAFTGKAEADQGRARLLEAMVTACVDHGVTPPSAQATIIASSVRASYEVCLAHGVGAITDVHGGAGAQAAVFYRECIAKVGKLDIRAVVNEYNAQRKRIPGLGHRVHKNDPRRDVLWKLADEARVSAAAVGLSRQISSVFREATGKELPINVDGVIGAIIADMGLDPSAAKSIFILGRVAGLSAHHYEELNTQPVMRQIDFGEAVYAGKPERQVPGGG